MYYSPNSCSWPEYTRLCADKNENSVKNGELLQVCIFAQDMNNNTRSKLPVLLVDGT